LKSEGLDIRPARKIIRLVTVHIIKRYHTEPGNSITQRRRQGVLQYEVSQQIFTEVSISNFTQKLPVAAVFYMRAKRTDGHYEAICVFRAYENEPKMAPK
jgi:hypothetical protein